jgi:long-subunit fatty acid transport protein
MAGFSWRGETFMQIDPLDANATTQLLAVNLPLRLAILDFYSPHTFTLGFTYFHDEALKLSLDGEFQMWSRFQVNSARSEYLKKVNESFEPFKNIFIVKFGAESRPGRYINKLRDVPLFVRTGFTFIPAFTPDQNGYSNFLDNNKIGYSLGASYFLNANKIVKVPVELIFGFQHQIMMPRESTKSGAVLGSNAYAAGNQPDYKYGGHVIIVSLGALMKF